MERFSYDEVKNFQVGDIFWARNDKYRVNTAPYINEIDYYNAWEYKQWTERVEWEAISLTTNKITNFQIHNGGGEDWSPDNVPQDPVIFKTSTSEPTIMMKGSHLKK